LRDGWCTGYWCAGGPLGWLLADWLVHWAHCSAPDRYSVSCHNTAPECCWVRCCLVLGSVLSTDSLVLGARIVWWWCAARRAAGCARSSTARCQTMLGIINWETTRPLGAPFGAPRLANRVWRTVCALFGALPGLPFVCCLRIVWCTALSGCLVWMLLASLL
jgi:hypothetical protein